MGRDIAPFFAQKSSQEFNVSYCQVLDLGWVAEQNYRHFKSDVPDRSSISLICKHWYLEINSNKIWAEIFQYFFAQVSSRGINVSYCQA